ncbi:4-hydroxy-tetrahydrodipicolinate synthase [Roseococcus sp. YIM B11640]|uniref:4-hydroxy-tetrahydrodipicolinate synthase n=1 Tax=Roseococcus sp. YIM B11640 TaxID=3133973 RepID=UPI003C7D587F
MRLFRGFAGIQGSIPALVTPFEAESMEPDLPALARLADRAVSRGSAAVVVCGTTGEAPAMSAEEQMRALAAVLEAVAGRAPVIAGIGASCTEGAVRLAESAGHMGASALLVSAPPYVRPGQEGLRAHVRAVSARSGLPVMLYDVPSRAAVGFADETIARLWEEGAIAAIKDATGDIARLFRLRRLCGAEFPQFSGDDATSPAHLAMGGAGCVSVTANVMPALCAAVQEAWRAGDLRRFAELADTLAPLHEALFVETNPVPAKMALHLLGFCAAEPRLPLVKAGEATMARLARSMAEITPLEETRARAMEAQRLLAAMPRRRYG